MYNAERNYFAGQLQQHGQASQIEADLQAEQPRQLVNWRTGKPQIAGRWNWNFAGK